MTPFTTLIARACPLPLANIDTDQLIPARFMKRPRSEGYGGFLLHDMRFDAEGRKKPESLLDQPQWAGAQVLIARRNFGSGSSREAAVYAVADFGFRCVLAPSFGDIFASNAVKNGVLPARVSESDAEMLLAHPLIVAGETIMIDLAAQTIAVGNSLVSFAIDPVWKTQLLHGWDDIDMTRSYAEAIAAFLDQDAVSRPWASPDR
jgi:3-isopropylmalate/(R)-2-methylmalate dehydratase small subunit